MFPKFIQAVFLNLLYWVHQKLNFQCMIWLKLFFENSQFVSRYSAEIVHRWGLTGFDLQAEPPRPEYLIKLSKAKKKKLNVVTQLHEPVVPFWKIKLPSLILSFTMAFFWSLVALGVVFGVVIYRMSYYTSDSLYRLVFILISKLSKYFITYII